MARYPPKGRYANGNANLPERGPGKSIVNSKLLTYN